VIRRVAGPLLALLLVALTAAPAAAAVPVVTPTGCPGADAPPPPPADAEVAAPPVAPLPQPGEPVGGPGMGACGDIGAAAPPEVSAAGFVLADLDSGAVLAARNPHSRHRPASTLKVLTALVVVKHLDPGTVVEGTADDLRVDGSKAGIGPGGQYTVRQLLAGLLLNSGNDTAAALARALGGTAATTAQMDATAHVLGALDTRAATPSGLDGPGQASSAYDLALLFRVALRDPLFAETIALRSISFPGYGAQPGFELSNANKLLARYPGTLGGKTGFTVAARHTFVAAATRNGRRLVVALVRGEQRPVPLWKQAAALLDLGFSLPRDAPAVGVLVDKAPAPPVAVPAQAAGENPVGNAAVGQAAVDRPAGSGSAVLAVAAAAGIGAALAVLVLRLRRG
jgi:D-alanyl-D-alanine carboxypeptidase (penicillin-binding protein 5/6)